MTFDEFKNKLKEIGFEYQDYELENKSDKMKFYFKYDKNTFFELVEKDSERYNELVYKGVLYGFEKEPIYIPRNRNIANELYSFFFNVKKDDNKYSLDFITILDEFKSLEEKTYPIMVPVFEMTEEDFNKILESDKLKEWFDILEEKSISNKENLKKHLEYYRSIIEENKECEIEHSSYNFNSKFSLKDGLIKFSISDNNLINFNDINIKCDDISNKNNAKSFIYIISLLV